MIRTAVIVLGVFWFFAANAQSIKLGRFLHPKDDVDRALNQTYLAGVQDGLLFYNVATEPTKRLYCQPGNLAITTEQANDIVERWAKTRTDNIGETSVALALLAGLQETFPCPK
jgi:hypothetical protein